MQDEKQGAESKVRVGHQAHTKGGGHWERTHVRDRARTPKATSQIAFVQQPLIVWRSANGSVALLKYPLYWVDFGSTYQHHIPYTYGISTT